MEHLRCSPDATMRVNRAHDAEPPRTGGRFMRIAPTASESSLATAARSVHELETRWRRQCEILHDLQRHHVPGAASEAQHIADDLKHTLARARRTFSQLKARA
jgi:hypothetical protein